MLTGLQIDLDNVTNAAFGDDTQSQAVEVSRILRKLADKLEGGILMDELESLPLKDVNGNTVGKITFGYGDEPCN